MPFLKTFIPIFVAIDIFAVIGIFVSLTDGMNERTKRTIIRKSVIGAFVTGVVFVFLGNAIFSLLGITVDDFKIAGGLILLVIAILELTGGREKGRFHRESGIVPLGVPVIVGPAVLTTLLILVEYMGTLITLLSFTLNLYAVYLSLIWSQRIIRFLGRDAVTAFSKIMALLLGSIAVMMIRIGIVNLIKM